MFDVFKPILGGRGEPLPGRDAPAYAVPDTHEVLGTPLAAPAADSGLAVLLVGMGCFWGAERVFWQLPGVVSTCVGYSGGSTPNPTYEEVCSGRTGHAEVVQVVYDPEQVSTADVIRTFWEAHDPTQGNRQGNDVGPQYRSALYTTTIEQAEVARETAARYGQQLASRGFGPVTTDIAPAAAFFAAEGYHQQYLAPTKNPDGYCGIRGTGVVCQVPAR